MFLQSDHDLIDSGGTATLAFGRAFVPAPAPAPLDVLRRRLGQTDWVPDLGSRIGSSEWFRGAATCLALIAGAVVLSPGLPAPILADTPPALTGTAWDEARAQSISPLAWGADSGHRMAANDLVVPLKETPERPIIELTATLGQGDGLESALKRAGVANREADRLADLVAGAMPLGDLKPGTRLDLTLGRRESRTVARPLEKLAFRARFDLALSIDRAGGALALTRHPIAIDHTPLRIRGSVGGSLYRAARSAGAPAKAVEAFIKAIATRTAVGALGTAATFDLIVEQARAATGEIQLGQLLYAGLDRGGKRVQLVKWEQDGRSQWFEANGVGEQRGVMAMPVAARITSGFGMRRHPVLGYMRMHKGMDFGAAYGTPIRAAIDGVVALAGRSGGYGNVVKLNHAGGIQSAYGHMSRIAVRPGARVARGQVIGYVGSTGMSTGPHLHFELWRGGVSINPRSVSFTTVAQLSGQALAQFKGRVASLMAVKPAN
ncbi:MAG: peptidoglycan DD-metalloendopeptidase family protein [Pseudomonadota bacterium]